MDGTIPKYASRRKKGTEEEQKEGNDLIPFFSKGLLLIFNLLQSDMTDTCGTAFATAAAAVAARYHQSQHHHKSSTSHLYCYAPPQVPPTALNKSPLHFSAQWPSPS